MNSKLLCTAILCVVALGAWADLPATGYDLSTITNPTADVTNYVGELDTDDLSATWKAATDTTDGAYGRVAIHDPTTPVEIPSEWERQGSRWIVHFRWTGTLSASGTQQLRVYPPSTANTPYAADATYGSEAVWADYHAVWHMSDADTQITDASGNGRHLTGSGTLTYQQTGKLGDAVSFGGGVFSGAFAAVTTYPYTLSAWFNFTSPNQSYGMVSVGDADADGSQTLRSQTGAELVAQTRTTTGIFSSAVIGTTASGTWMLGHAVFESDANRTVYLDNEVPVNDTSTGNPGTAFDLTTVGARAAALTGDLIYSGLLDEVRIANFAISPERRALERTNTDDMTAFWGTWTWQEPVSTTPAYILIFREK